MKALLLIAACISAFLIILGLLSRNAAGTVMASALIAAGLFIAIIVLAVWVILFIKEKKEKGS